MAIAVVFEFPGVSVQQYEDVCRKLNNGNLLTSLADWPYPGILSHTAGATPDGLCVLDVWETPEQFAQFGEALVPLLMESGFPQTEPRVFLLTTSSGSSSRGQTSRSPV